MREAAKDAGKGLYDWANEQVDSVRPDEQEILFLPYLYGGIDDARTKALVFGLEAWHNRAQVIRAFCEGIVFGHRMQVERLQRSRHVPVDTVRLAGGVVRSANWVQMFADILQLRIETIEADELGALGAAMTAARVFGRYESLEEAAATMSRVVKTYVPNADDKGSYDRKFGRFLQVSDLAMAFYTGQGGTK